MPGLDGLELARVLRRFASQPQLVFVRAYDNAAVEAFELHALDYLRKPVARRRVEEAVERVAAAIEPHRRKIQAPSPARSRTPRRRRATTRWFAVATLHGGSTRLLSRSAVEYVQS